MDVFGDWTPQFVLAGLRSEFPDCFFFIEHPNDIAERTVNSYRWFGLKSDLEKYVAPNSLGIVLPGIMFGKDPELHKKILETVWNKPGYMMFVHREGRNLLKIMNQQNEVK